MASRDFLSYSQPFKVVFIADDIFLSHSRYCKSDRYNTYRHSRTVLIQRIDIFCQCLSVIEGGRPHQRIIRFGSLVNVVERSVLDKGQAQKARDLEKGSVRRGQGEHDAASSSGRTAHQRGPIGTF